MTAENIHEKLIAGLRNFFAQSGKTSAVVGLSGGIDSSVVAALAVDALGKENVRGLMMPSQYSTLHSVADALLLTENLGITHHLIPVENIYHAFIKELTPVFGSKKKTDITEENLQARIRATLLMAISNKYDCLVLNTSNKSELAMGYGTLYGDLIGALMVIGDLYKTQVYETAWYINRNKPIIPLNIIQKEPSAELHPGQKDSDSLPPYAQLDPILHALIEEQLSPDETIQKGFDADTVARIANQKAQVAFKGHQLPQMIKISDRPLASREKWTF
ncbi:MAG: NAD(+) synthase [Prevotellaceae bacterium]|jgi:NAD+ synthase (glutamine-hydrolysing)|nr:NAD(+) synthase [Prevotellaceae bacterium]